MVYALGITSTEVAYAGGRVQFSRENRPPPAERGQSEKIEGPRKGASPKHARSVFIIPKSVFERK